MASSAAKKGEDLLFAHGITHIELTRGWPAGYPGSFAAFTVPNDPRPMLRERDLVYASRWANAALARYCLRYNSAAKTEWP